jgi:hypothetical protein
MEFLHQMIVRAVNNFGYLRPRVSVIREFPYLTPAAFETSIQITGKVFFDFCSQVGGVFRIAYESGFSFDNVLT